MRKGDDWDVNDFGKGDGVTKPQVQAAAISAWNRPVVKIALIAVAIIAVLWVLF